MSHTPRSTLPASQAQPLLPGQHWLLGMHCPLHSYWPAAVVKTRRKVLFRGAPNTPPALFDRAASALPVGHAQAPAWHSVPFWQALPHAPQFSISDSRWVWQPVLPSPQFA